MSFPPPPGLSQQPSRSPSDQSQPHASLPPRPPAASYNQSGPPGTSSGNHSHGSAGPRGAPPSAGSFTAFQPRAVAASQPFRTHSPAVSGTSTPAGGFSSPTPTATTGGHATTYSSGYQQPQQQQQQHYGQYYYGQQPNPQTRPPYSASQNNYSSYGTAGGGGRGYPRHDNRGLDPETEAQIAQWQSAYMGKESEAQQAPPAGKGTTGRREGVPYATGANTGPLGNTQQSQDSSAVSTPTAGQQPASATSAPGAAPDPATAGKTVIRSGGGQSWTDSTLLEWDPAHFRLFAGNLAGEVTDDSLLKAFAKYPSIQKARVIRDKRTEKSKGYGFVSFSDGDDYFRAAREMQGKYIGSHPVLLRRAMTEIRPVSAKSGSKGGKKGGGHTAGSGAGGGGMGGKAGNGGKPSQGGVQKKQGKTKGGLKVLG